MGSAASNISPDRDLLDLHGHVAIVTGAKCVIVILDYHPAPISRRWWLAARTTNSLMKHFLPLLFGKPLLSKFRHRSVHCAPPREARREGVHCGEERGKGRARDRADGRGGHGGAPGSAGMASDRPNGPA